MVGTCWTDSGVLVRDLLIRISCRHLLMLVAKIFSPACRFGFLRFFFFVDLVWQGFNILTWAATNWMSATRWIFTKTQISKLRFGPSRTLHIWFARDAFVLRTPMLFVGAHNYNDKSRHFCEQMIICQSYMFWVQMCAPRSCHRLTGNYACLTQGGYLIRYRGPGPT